MTTNIDRAADLLDRMHAADQMAMEGEIGYFDAPAAARVILNDLPAPPRPTLADMTDEERAACQWMQCEVEGVKKRCVIANPYDAEGDTALVSVDGGVRWVSPARVTPRPDLPRLEWPSDKKPAPALPEGWRLADHPHHGRVLVVKEDGENVIFGAPFKATGIRTHVGLVTDLTFVDTDNDQKPEDVTPVKVGDVIESADDPRLDALPVGSMLIDRDGGVFDVTKNYTGEWDGPGYVPAQGTGTKWGPWTVRRIGKEADQ